MKKLYCPKCGYGNRPDSRFCRHCGYNLMKYKQRMNYVKSYVTPPYTQDNSQYTSRQFQQSQQPQQSQPAPQTIRIVHTKQHHNHTGLIISLIIIIIALIAFAGIGNYNSNSWPFGSSNKSNYSVVKTFWSHIDNRLDSSDSKGGSTSLNPLFKNGGSNYSLGGMKDWLRFVEKSNEVNDITVTSIKPYNFSTSNGEVRYKVRYNFDVHSKNYNHIQIYDWHTKIKNGKIVSMSSTKKPTKDYND